MIDFIYECLATAGKCFFGFGIIILAVFIIAAVCNDLRRWLAQR